jgi:hypothetical protein
MSRLNAKNVHCHSDQIPFDSRLLYNNVKVKLKLYLLQAVEAPRVASGQGSHIS